MENLIKNTILVLVMIFLGLFLVGCEKDNPQPEQTITVTTYSFEGGISPDNTSKKFISTETVFKKDIENGYFTKKVKSLSGLKLVFETKNLYDDYYISFDDILNQIFEGYMQSPYEYVEGGSEENIEYMISTLNPDRITPDFYQAYINHMCDFR